MTDRADEDHSVARAKNLSRFFFFDHQRAVSSWRMVSRFEATLSVEHPWQQRIVELADGRPLREVIEVLYQEQLDRGARLTDLGMWKSLFDRQVTAAAGDLVHRGVIDLNSNGNLERRSELSTAGETKRPRLTVGTIDEKTTGRANLDPLVGVAHSSQYGSFEKPADGYPAPKHATPQKWSAGLPAPTQNRRVEHPEAVTAGRVGVGQSALSQNALGSGRSLPAAMLRFLVRAVRRGPRGVGRLRGPTMETKREVMPM